MEKIQTDSLRRAGGSRWIAILMVLAAVAWNEEVAGQTNTAYAPAPADAATAAAPAAAAPATAPAPPPSAPAKKSAAELQKLVEPIALHPDPLIAAILTASVYPLEVVQAARFVRDTNNIAKLDEQPWDENVKTVARFPTMIAKMDADLNWTTQLGQAFLDQQTEVMDAIQFLRNKAQGAGTLRTTDQQIVVVTNVVQEKTIEQQVVVVTNTVVQIQPANPQVIYVPTYPPTVYYPPPAYVYDPYAPLITFGMGMAVGAIIANNCDWNHGCVSHHDYHGDVDVNVDRNVNRNVNRNTNRERPAQNGNRGGGTKWQPDQNRLRNSGAAGSAQTREARGWGGTGAGAQRPGAGGARASQLPAGGAGGARASQLPAGGAGGARPGQQPARPAAGTQPARSQGAGGGQANWPGQRPTQQPAGGRQQAGASARPAQSSSFNRGSQGSSAFGGVNSGRSAQSFSNRGAASRGGGGGRGGGGRGGGGGRR